MRLTNDRRSWPEFGAVTVAVVYAAAAGAWILFSDGLLHLLTGGGEAERALQSVKGLLFVGVTAGLLFLLLRGALDRSRRTAVSLARGEDIYRQMFLGNQAVKLLIDPVDGRIVDANPAAESFYGWSVERLKTMCIYDVNTLTKSEIFAEMALAKEQHRTHFLFRHRLASGKIRHVEVHSSPVHVSGRTLLFSIVHDVTERQQVLDALRQSEERFRDIVEAVSDWFWEMDDQFRFTNFSGRSTLLVGRPLAEMIGKTRWDLALPGDDPDKWAKHRADLVAHRPFRNFEYMAKAADDSARWVSVSGKPYFDAKGAFLGYRGTARDVTEARNAEERLRTLSRAVEQSPVSVVITDPRGIIRYVNPWFCKVTGYTAEEVIGQNPRILKSGDLSAGEYERLWQTISVGGDWHGEFHNRKKDGALYWESAVISPIKSADGAITHFVAVKEDITQRKAAEQALRRALDDARLANRAKDEFLANMSHELRTPLNSIIGFSDILTAETFGALGDAHYKEYAQDINTSGKHLLELINDILDVARIEVGQLDLKETRIDIAQVLASCRRMVGERASAHKLNLTLNVEPGLPALLADERRFKQVMLNLLSNAIKFTPEDGRVMVRAYREMDGALSIVIADTGIGIRPEDFEKVLTPFGQVDGSLTRRFDGAGLGLPLARELIRMHDGTLTLDSVPGQGTTVTVRFPPERTVMV